MIKSPLKHLASLTLSTLMILPAVADTSWQNSLTTTPAGPYHKKKPCQLNYALTWKGSIQAGECSVKFDRNSGKSRSVGVECTGKTAGLARKAFPYDFKLISKYRGDSLQASSFKIWESTKDEVKEIDAKFSGSKVTSKEKSVPHGSKKAEYESNTFAYPNLRDLYSGILYVGSLPLNNGERVNTVIYPFDKPYLIKVKVLGREKHLGYDCIKLDLQMNKINPNLTLKHYDKMKSTTMWITDNSDRVMVELRSKVFIGDVRATLKSSEWY